MAWKIGHPIKRDGTNQAQRLPVALDPKRNPIDGRRKEDLLLFLYGIADQFAYYNISNKVDGDWQTFFSELEDEVGDVNIESIRVFLAKSKYRQDHSTFMTMILAFLDLFSHVQKDINTLTQKHLEFYFEQVLGFRRLPAKPDEVHLFFELSSQTQQHRIPIGTALEAGSDAQGKPLTYFVNREIVVNRTRLAAIKTTILADDGSIYAAEVANSEDGLGIALEGEPPQWPTFGHKDNMQPSTIGFAIASPLLLLDEGERIITLTLTFEDIPQQVTKDDFKIFHAYASGEEAWIPLGMDVEEGDFSTKKLTLKMIAQPNQPAIISLNENLESSLKTNFPVIKLLLDPQQTSSKLFQDLKIKSLDLTVEVTATEEQAGLQKLVVQNDIGVLDASSSFFPFGTVPSKGSLFYVGSKEVFSKPIKTLKIQLKWANLPTNTEGFANHYKEYSDAKLKGNDKYHVSTQLLRDGKWLDIDMDDDNKKLFASEDNRTLISDKTLTLADPKFEKLLFTQDLEGLEEYDSSLNQGFIRLTLGQDFGHRLYPKVFAQIAATAPGVKTFPNEAYTPSLQSISLGYTASQTISLERENKCAAFFHIQPFGSEKLKPSAPVRLLPQLPRAALYLGFEGLEAPQNLHLLFQIAEGSADPSLAIKPEDLEWTYLTAKGWRATPLRGSEVIMDSTLGLQKSGILALRIGKDASKESSLLPPGMHWLRAQLSADPKGAAKTIAIHTQAITAVFQDQENDPSHLRSPLAANSISSLAESDSNIEKVEQPYASFGGKSAEQGEVFYTRISERLRHKNRAITLWDMERLVLQAFPSLYEVKAIPHTGFYRDKDGEAFYSEFQPGQATLVVIPQLHNQNAVNPLQPSVSVIFLEEIRQYLLPLCTQFLGYSDSPALHIINPQYESIQLSFSVSFKEGYDPGFYAEQLNQALRRKLSPWAFEEGEGIRFGGKIYKSQLLAFVEEQQYVDYVIDFKMLHSDAGPGIGQMCVELDFVVRDHSNQGVDVAIASTAASILVSATEHTINILKPNEFPCAEINICGEGIGCWYIEADFIIS